MKCVLTDVHNPSEPNGADETTISEALNPQGERKTSPAAYEVPSCLPEEDGDASTSNTRHAAGQDEHTTDCVIWRVDGGKNPELENQDEADER